MPALEIVFRCYDEGVAFRYQIPGEKASGPLHVLKERTEFSFAKDYPAWRVNSAQGVYTKKSIDTMGSGVERPLTIEMDDAVFVAIHIEPE